MYIGIYNTEGFGQILKMIILRVRIYNNSWSRIYNEVNKWSGVQFTYAQVETPRPSQPFIHPRARTGAIAQKKNHNSAR